MSGSRRGRDAAKVASISCPPSGCEAEAADEGEEHRERRVSSAAVLCKTLVCGLVSEGRKSQISAGLSGRNLVLPVNASCRGQRCSLSQGVLILVVI